MLPDDDSRRDELTGLANRRAYDEALVREVERSRRSGDPLGLVAVDIDNFKPINDFDGLQQGDQVLREVARILRESCREIDLPARVGGDQFTVVLPVPTSPAPTSWPSACAPRSRRWRSPPWTEGARCRSRPALAWPRCPRTLTTGGR